MQIAFFKICRGGSLPPPSPQSRAEARRRRGLFGPEGPLFLLSAARGRVTKGDKVAGHLVSDKAVARLAKSAAAGLDSEYFCGHPLWEGHAMGSGAGDVAVGGGEYRCDE